MQCFNCLLYILFVETQFLCGQAQKEVQDDQEQFPSRIRVSSWNDMPFSGITEENGQWIGKGYAFYILDILSAELNFTYTILPPTKHIIGDEHNGILSLLYQEKVDMIAAFLPVLDELRLQYLFSTTLDELQITALMKRPRVSATSSDLLAPFQKTVWLLVFTAVIFVGPVIYLISTIRSKLWKNTNGENFNLPSYIWFVYSALLKQGSTITAQTDSTRILFATWWIFVLILTSFYTANLTAFLTKPQFTLPINNIKDIVNKGYKWATLKGRIMEYLLSQPLINEVTPLNRVKFKGEYITAYENPSKFIFSAIEKNKLYFADSHYLHTLLFNNYIKRAQEGFKHEHRCTYVIMPGYFFSKHTAFAFPLNSTIADPINKLLSTVVEAGLIKHIKQNDLPLAEICPVDLQSNERRLKNSDLSLTYKIVIAGYVIAAIVFVIELFLRNTSIYIKNKKIEVKKNMVEEIISEQKQLPKFNALSNSGNEITVKFNLTKNNPSPFGPNAGNISLLGKRHNINGRSYYVVVDRNGRQRLIPTRTPSAFLFQYAA